MNGELFGLYVLREALDKRFLERNFRDPDGNLYEAPFDVDIGDTRMELRTNETKNDKSDVAAVGAVVADAPDADFLARVRTLVDLREFFRYWAVETITAHWDGYASLSGLPFWDPYNTRFDNYRPNNYYTYSDPSTGKFVFLPWGADLSLGNLLYMGSGSSVNVLWPPKEDADFAVRVYAQPGEPERFRAALTSVLDQAWHPEKLVARAHALAALVRANGLTSPCERDDDGHVRSSARRSDRVHQ